MALALALLVTLTPAPDATFLPTTPAPSLTGDGLLPLTGEPDPPTLLAIDAPTQTPVSGPERELPLVHGGFAAPSAWLALWRGDAWICWDLAMSQCWQRLDLAGQVDLPALRAEFVDRSTLVLGDRSDITWLIVRGDPVPRPVAWTATPRQSPQTHSCSPSGPLPIADDTGLHSRDRPCPEARERHDSCAHPGHALRLRHPHPLRLRLGVELQARRDWHLRGDLHNTTGIQLIALVAIGLDPAGWALQRRERADLQAQARPGLRALPAPRSRGPLQAAEHQALRTALCGR